MACGEMKADREGIERLLDFLVRSAASIPVCDGMPWADGVGFRWQGHSFKGGTDVTGAVSTFARVILLVLVHFQH
eukprot:3760790-Rhodomonas_salina.2